ncbi:MAG TPA: GyrI-like domain-containing protein [Polyangiaceae bacterium]|nr:GyrI-like domain-containing protein [Polyangiaceae bacterium]
MKESTRSFYVSLVQHTVARILGCMDEALDLGELAREQALSPLHLHRILRGLLGETPLELHRRLRLERAAWRLVHTTRTVTRVAFEAGYETHESFTRSFREAFAVSPSEYRARGSARGEGATCAPPISFILPAASGIHFVPEGASAALSASSMERTEAELLQIPWLTGEQLMQIDVQWMPEMRVAAVAHRGPYNRISEAFAKLGAVAAREGLLANRTEAPKMIAIYYDDPESTPAAELRADAGLSVEPEAVIPDGLHTIVVPPGRYARAVHVGPYSQLGDAWARFLGQGLPQSGYRVGSGPSYELYVNNPQNAQPAELRTELYVFVEECPK